MVGAQGKTLESWVVKLLGGLSASARAQRILVSLSLWRVYTLQRGSRFVGDGMFFCGDRQAAWRPGALRVGLEHSELTSVAQDSVTFEENLKGTVQTGGVHRRLRALRCVSVETAPSGVRAVRKSIKPLSR